MSAALLSGMTMAALQFNLHEPKRLVSGITERVSGIVILIDGQADHRNRLWVRLDNAVGTKWAGVLPKGSIIRVTAKAQQSQLHVGQHISGTARLYPPPSRLLAGTADFSLTARINDVSASGFFILPISLRQQEIEPRDGDLTVKLARYRAHVADRIMAVMKPTEGAIATALLVGERRFISEATYDQFRRSGLAHLLAISGLHMGLLCFGTIALIRSVGAGFPTHAVRLPLHKYAAVGALVTGVCYVFLSGASISAVRAYVMVVLIVIAVISDRIAVTTRNVALAALIILIANPAALFSASFQLSFAATTILVFWYEFWAGHSDRTLRVAWPIRYLGGLIVSAILASIATAPFTAQHFGMVTPWGVLANIVGVPLTGLWIMPTGILTAFAMLFGAESVFAPMLQSGISALILVADWISGFPHAGWRVSPPGYVVLSLIVTAVISARVFKRPHALMGGAIGMIAFAIFLITPVPDGVIIGTSRKTALILSSGGKEAISYQPLSAFVRSLSVLRLGRSIRQSDNIKCNIYCRHQMPDERVVGLLWHKKALAIACRDPETDFIIVPTADVKGCKNNKTLYRLDVGRDKNYLIFIKNKRIKMVSNSGSVRQVCPEPQPRRC